MRRRGFTIAELAITIAVSTLLVSAVIALLVSLQEYSQFRAADIPVREELEQIEREIKDFFASYDSAEYPAPEPDASGSALRFGSDDSIAASGSSPCTLTFTSLTDGEVSAEILTAPSVASVLFESGRRENIIKATIHYRDGENEEKSYSFMLVKKSANRTASSEAS